MSRTTTPPAAQSKYFRPCGERIAFAGRAALDDRTSVDDTFNEGLDGELDDGLDGVLNGELDEGFNGGVRGNLEAADVLGSL